MEPLLHRMSRLLFALVIVPLGFVFAESPAAVRPYELHVGAVTMEPPEGVQLVGVGGAEPFVIQFHDIADRETRRRLESSGVTFLRSLGGSGYVATCDPACRDTLRSEPKIRAAFALEPAMKRSWVFDHDPALRAWTASASPIRVHVRFLDRVSFEDAANLVTAAGGRLTAANFSRLHSITLDATWPELRSILELPQVISVDPALPFPGPTAVDSAHRLRADQVRHQPRFFNVDGAGQRIGIWDWFSEPHLEFEDRIIVDQVRFGEWGHGVLVSGPAAAAGIEEPLALGMAPGAELIWHSYDSADNWSDMERLHDDLGMSIVNNSWSIHPGWFFDRLDGQPSWHGGLWAYGYYHEWTEEADQVAFDTDLLIVFAAGNEVEVDYLGPHTHGNIYGQDGSSLIEDLHPPNPVFTSLAGPSVGKNVITVGGSTKEDELAWFSSRGPTLDGRIKPDVMAPAIDVVTTAPEGGYTLSGGTSLAAPTVCGIAALLRDLHDNVHNFDISSVSLKNVLIHSARDLGLPGPDYTYGHGLVDAELAARIVRDAVFHPEDFVRPRNPSGRRFQTRSTMDSGDASEVNGVGRVAALMVDDIIEHGELRSFRFPAGSATDLRATLVWHDPPADVLVNDLDIRLESPSGAVFLPWALDPERPAEGATKGVNRRDNVESVSVKGPEHGWWTVIVDAHAVPLGPQRFSLIVSGSDGNIASERLGSGELELHEFWTTSTPDDGSDAVRTTVFSAGDPLNFYGRLTITDLPDYGNFKGLVTFTGSVRNEHGEVVATGTNATHTWTGEGEVGGTIGMGWVIPEELPLGIYTVDFGMFLSNGREAGLETTLEIR